MSPRGSCWGFRSLCPLYDHSLSPFTGGLLRSVGYLSGMSTHYGTSQTLQNRRANVDRVALMVSVFYNTITARQLKTKSGYHQKQGTQEAWLPDENRPWRRRSPPKVQFNRLLGQEFLQLALSGVGSLQACWLL